MKTVVSLQELLEQEIKPGRLLAEYAALTATEVQRRWSGGKGLVEVSCPGCGGHDSQRAFDKLGLTYRVCAACGSLFVSPRPSEDDLVAYYRDALPARFWQERVLPSTREARVEKLVAPRAEWVADGVAEYLPDARSFADIGHAAGPLLAAVRESWPATTRTLAAHPLAGMDGEGGPGIEVRPVPSAGLAALGPVDAVIAIDAFDRAADLPALVESARRMLRPGGLLFVMAPCASGFDLQVLWDCSTAVLPPDKLNLLSAEGYLARFSAPAWEILEFSTPGMFDVENVRRAVETEPDRNWSRFIRTLVTRDETARVEFQTYLQRFRLASFARLVVRRAS